MAATKNSYPELSTLRAFILTAQEGSTAGAAKQMGVSQPAISAALHRLEEIVGHPLFDRSSRPMQLTVAGRILRGRIEPIVEELEQIGANIGSIINTTELDLRLGCSDSFSGCVCAELLPRLAPFIRNLQAYGHSTPKILEKLIDDKLDIAVATKFPSDNPDVNGFQILSENFIVVTPKAYENSIRSIHDLAILPKTLPVIRFNDDSLDSIQIERVLRQCNIKGGRTIAADTNASVLGFVNSGIGWTVMPALSIWMARDEMDNVAFQDIAGLKACRTFYIMYKNPAYAQLTMKILKEAQQIFRDRLLPEIGKKSPRLAQSIQLCSLS